MLIPHLFRGLEADCIRVVKETISKLGGLDVSHNFKEHYILLHMSCE
jgi:hypothetical protein